MSMPLAISQVMTEIEVQVSKLEGRLSQVQTEKEEVGRQCVAEQKRAVAAESQGQQRLIGALRRLDYLVSCLLA